VQRRREQARLWCVFIPGGNQLDRRRHGLRPCDYLSDPALFGSVRPVARVVPAGGDEPASRVAWVQHRLVVQWRQCPGRRSGAAIAREFGFSRQTWSRTTLGERWAGQTVLTALLLALDRRGRP